MHCFTTILAVAMMAAICGCNDNGPLAGGSLGQQQAAALEQKNPETLASTLIATSADQHAAGDAVAAAESLSAATRAALEVANAAAQAKLFLQISDAQVGQGNAKAALATLAKADSAARQVIEPAARAAALARIGALYARPHKQIAPAIAAVEEAQKATGSIDNAQLRVEVYCAVAKAYATLDKFADANRMLGFAATTAKTLDNPERQNNSLAVVAAAQVELKEQLSKK
jgi:hypothetical protein